MTRSAVTDAIDPVEVELFAGRLFEAGLGAVELVNIVLGARLGLYDALALQGSVTPAELAAQTGIAERYVREWLEQQAVAEVLDVEDPTLGDDERRYGLSPSRAHVLLAEGSDAHMMPLAASALVAGTWLDFLEPAYRSGTGVPYAEFGVHGLQAAFTRAVAEHHLVQRWLPLLPDLQHRLADGARVRVAEVGCGEGRAAIGMAKAYPEVTIDAVDLDDASIAEARRHAVEAGVADRVRFEVGDGADLRTTDPYDLVLCVEVLHDTHDPVAVLRAMRGLRSDGGIVLVVDERVAPRFTLPASPVERLLYAFSTLHCLPVGMAEQPSAATGAVMRPETVRRYAVAAGFSSVDELADDHPQFRLYLLEG